MSDERKRYRRRAGQAVSAVEIRLDTEGLHYHKRGHEQFAKPGDWLVDNGGDVYTVGAASFARTHKQVGPGAYVKSAPVWAERASSPGSVATQEGRTNYAAGDWLVRNSEDGSNAYAISAAKFRKLYELDEGRSEPPEDHR